MTGNKQRVILMMWLNKNRHTFCNIIMKTTASWWTQNTIATQIWVSAHTLRNALLKKKSSQNYRKNLKQKNPYLNSTHRHNLRIYATTLSTLCINVIKIYTFYNVPFKVMEYLMPLHFYVLRIIVITQDSKLPKEFDIACTVKRNQLY